jgi:hypothetical protein
MTSLEYDTQQELETCRTQLGIEIPKRLEELNQIVWSRSSHTEEWYANVFSKLSGAVTRTCLDLRATIERDDLPAAAWNSRNLLELWVWARFCSASPKNARRFYEDALRDMAGLGEAHTKMCNLTNVPDNSEWRKKIAEVGRKELGLDAVTTDYARVGDAAKECGLEEWYRSNNAFLSKFAHPTAGLIIGWMHQHKHVRDMQNACTTQGMYFAGQCVIVLSGAVLALPLE